MKIGQRGLAIGGGVLIAAVALGWFAFERYAIQLPAMMMDWRDPIGPNRAVEWAAGPDAPQAAAENRPPNIVLIVADDLGWNNITLNGGGVAGGTVPTPNIDSIAKAGLVLSHGYSGSGTCAPSRAAMMSGRYPTRFGFEFTPMPPGMARITTRFAAEDETALRKARSFISPRWACRRAKSRWATCCRMPATTLSTSASGIWVRPTAWPPTTRASTKVC